MLLFIELLFIVLLGVILFMIYRRENLLSKNGRRKAALEGYWSGKERRRHTRFNDTLEVEYTVTRKSPIKNRGHTVDISEGGLRVLIDEKLANGSMLELLVSFPKNGKQARVAGEVVWSEEIDKADSSGKRLFYAGLRFLAIKEPADNIFVDYIRSLPASSET